MEKENKFQDFKTFQECAKWIFESVNILDVTSSSFIIINDKTQVIYKNDATNAATHGEVPNTDERKLQPGDLFECANAALSKDGCGTSINCPNCVFRNTIKKAFASKQVTTCEVVLTLTKNRTLALKAIINPFSFHGNNYAAVFITNIYDTIRMRMITRVFFHDILNLAGAIQGYLNIMEGIDDITAFKESTSQLQSISNQLIDEITSQRDIMFAEQRNLKISIEKINLKEYMSMLNTHIKGLLAQKSCFVDMPSVPENETILTDQKILERILYNMIKNAIEFVHEGEHITVNVELFERSIQFSVHNGGVIPDKIRNLIFQFGSSTKGAGHGIGTYSMKLLGEEFLKGRVWFESTEEKGTTFYIKVPR